MSTYGPRTVEAGAVRRWTKQSVQLIVRAPIAFGALVGAIFAITHFMEPLHRFLWELNVQFLLDMFVGLTSIVAILVAARWSDIRVWKIAPGSLKIIYRYFLFFITVIGIVFLAFSFMQRTEVYRDNLFVRSIFMSVMISDIGIISFCGAMFHGVRFMNIGDGFYYSSEAAFMNPLLRVAFPVVILLNFAISFFPYAAVPLTIFFTVLYYVAFRDIYEHRDGNMEHATEAKASLVMT